MLELEAVPPALPICHQVQFCPAVRVVESGRQRVVKLAVKAERWAVSKACSERLRTWLTATAPQLEAAGQILRRLARQTPEDPEETPLQPASG
ncbi:MAG: hypothetical protein MUE94_08600 [Verrucomicrobia bacterium]|jgi:hypothetical protein|nr:hypothetical protein [Verrucomicrobiota bacterium]